ncbi:MAG: protein kinase [Candidatus Nomurabacteria bacterium]|nr:protein kinase [Candidatus Nomurabacteria bacterium]
MGVEKIDQEFYMKGKELEGLTLSPEDATEHVHAIAHEIFTKKSFVGKGEYARVFRDTLENGLCYKKLLSHKTPTNSVKQEAEFLREVHGIHKDVKTPFPVASFSAVVKNEETGNLSKQYALVMEYFDAPNLEVLITEKQDLPTNFDVDVFCDKLEDFIKQMHKKNIYHRDIALRNVLIDPETNNPVVIDFGNALFYSYDTQAKLDPYDRRYIAEEGEEYNDEKLVSGGINDADLNNVELIRWELERFKKA